ncbi:hypothetical protein BU17DRAFT_68828 [Hysterangium stoloniferum]|nr:hypothetical protein BU17DRAFT_68828 [Hysterangium stoloniferum]
MPMDVVATVVSSSGSAVMPMDVVAAVVVAVVVAVMVTVVVVWCGNGNGNGSGGGSGNSSGSGSGRENGNTGSDVALPTDKMQGGAKHYLPVDMRYLGIESTREEVADIFMPVSASSGRITATVARCHHRILGNLRHMWIVWWILEDMPKGGGCDVRPASALRADRRDECDEVLEMSSNGLWALPVASNLLHPFVIVNIAALISKIFVGAMRGELTKCGIGTKDTVEWQWYMEHGLLGMDSQIVVPVPRTSMGLMKTTTFDFEFCEPTFANGCVVWEVGGMCTRSKGCSKGPDFTLGTALCGRELGQAIVKGLRMWWQTQCTHLRVERRQLVLSRLECQGVDRQYAEKWTDTVGREEMQRGVDSRGDRAKRTNAVTHRSRPTQRCAEVEWDRCDER